MGSAAGAANNLAGSGNTAAGTGNSAGSFNAAGASSGGTSGGGASGTGTSGAAGSQPTAGAGGAGSHASGRSAGCGKIVDESPTLWNTHSIAVTVDAAYAADFSTRTYFTRPPKNYDASKAYPVIVWGQGCGQSKAEDTQITGGPGADNAIQVELLANPKNHNCYSAGPDGDNANSPELPYFDAVLAEAEAAFCVDKGKVYMGGWSSGGWLSTLVACTRSSVIKGVGWASAGLQVNHPACVGPMPAILERGTRDTGTMLDRTLAARDDLIMRNGCTSESEPWDPGETAFDTSTCVSYKGCMPGFPVIWCPIDDVHNNGGKLSQFGFWKFWSALP